MYRSVQLAALINEQAIAFSANQASLNAALEPEAPPFELAMAVASAEKAKLEREEDDVKQKLLALDEWVVEEKQQV